VEVVGERGVGILCSQTQLVTASFSASPRATKPECPHRCPSRDIPAIGAPRGFSADRGHLSESLGDGVCQCLKRGQTQQRQLSTPYGAGLEVNLHACGVHAPSSMHLTYPPLLYASSMTSSRQTCGAANSAKAESAIQRGNARAGQTLCMVHPDGSFGACPVSCPDFIFMLPRQPNRCRESQILGSY
jgi:hypothetical protein